MKTNLLNDLSNVLKKGTSLSEKGTSLNLLPKMDRECIENDSRMDRQSLGKIFRYAAVLFMLFMVGIGNVWAYWYIPGSGWTWNVDDGSKMNGENYITYYALPAGTYTFKIAEKSTGDANWFTGNPTEGTDANNVMTVTKGTNEGDNNTLVLTETADVQFDLTNEVYKDVTVNAYPPTYFIKYPFGGGDWTWYQLYADGTGTYSVRGNYSGSSSTGYNYRKRTSNSDTWKSDATSSKVTRVNSPSSTSDVCIFTYDPSTDNLTIRKCNTVTKTNHIYFDNTESNWTDSKIQFVIGHPNYSRTYVMSTITNTAMTYVAPSENADWTDAGYYAMIGGASKFTDGEWASGNIYTATHYSSPYTTPFNFRGSNKVYVISKTSADNGTAITIDEKSSTGYSQFNAYNQIFKYQVSGDNGLSYHDMTSSDGKTPGSISMSWYKYTSASAVSSQTTQSAEKNSSNYTKTASNAGYRTKTTLTESETVSGYTFIGWFVEGVEKSTAATYTYYPKSATTVQARFKANQYTVTLDDDGGSGGSGSKYVYYNATTNLTTSVDVPEKDGYAFGGYFTEKNGGGTQLINADGSWKASVASYTSSSKQWIKLGNEKVYAKWTATCSTPAAPTAFATSSVWSTSATFTITDAGDAASYDLYYASGSPSDPTSGTTATTNVTTKTPTITGLTASTSYKIWVRSVCDASHKSSWVALGTTSFTTLDPPCFVYTGGKKAGSGWPVAASGSITTSLYESSTGASLSGGTVTNSGSGTIGSNDDVKGLVFNGTSEQITVTLTGSNKFGVGTIIVISGASGDDNTSSHSFGFSANSVNLPTVSKSGKKESFETSYTVTSSDGIDGESAIIIKLNTSCNRKTYLKGVTIYECSDDACAATAAAGTDKSTTVGVGVSMAATAASSGYTGAWSIKTGPSTSTSQLSSTSAYNATFTPTASGTYTLIWTVTDDSDGSCYATDEADVTVTKNTPTSYTVSGTTSFCPGGDADITLSGSQSGISYQLYRGASTVGDAKAGTGSALTWEDQSTAGTYTVKTVENTTYAQATMSGSAVLTVKTNISIGTQPSDVDDAVAETATSITGLVASGTNPSYQWYTCDDAEKTNATAISAAGAMSFTGYTTATLGLTPTTAGTTYYYCVVSGDCGDPVTSDVVTVTAAACSPTVIAGIEVSGYNTGTNHTGTLKGSYTVSLQNSDAVSYDEHAGYKIADGNYISLTLKSGEYFHDGDKAKVYITKKGDIDGKDLRIYAGASAAGTLVGSLAAASVQKGWNEVTIDVPNSTTASLTVHRGSGDTEQNHYVYAFKVERPCSGYTISFQGNGNTGGSMSDVSEIEEGDNVTLSTNGFTKNGYTFANWTADVDVTVNSETVSVGSAIANQATIQNVTSDITLTAQWTPNTYTITYNLNGASWASSAGVASYTVGTGATLPVAGDMTNTGYTFGGWYDNSGLTGPSVTAIGTSDYGNKEFWAKWTENEYDVTYDKNGGSGDAMSATHGHYVTISDNSYTAPSGKAFVEWNTASNGSGASYNPGDEIELTADLPLYAIWADDYTITWDASAKLGGVAVTPNLGGGNYTITASVSAWTGTLTTSMISAVTDGVTITNVAVDNSVSPKTITATFNVGASVEGESISFTLDVPAAGVYGAKSSTEDFDIDRCTGSSSGSDGVLFSAEFKDSGLGNENICDAANTPYTFTTTELKAAPTGGSIKAYTTSNLSHMTFATNAISIAGSNGVIQIDLDNAIQTYDLFTYVNVNSSSSSAYLRHTSADNETDQIALTVYNSKEVKVMLPAGYNGKKRLYLVRNNKNFNLHKAAVVRPAFLMLLRDDTPTEDTNLSGTDVSLTTDNYLAVISGGSATFTSPSSGNLKIKRSSSKNYIQFNNAAGYVKVVLSSALAEGDVIGFDSYNTNEIALTTTAERSTTIHTSSQLYTVNASSALKGQTTFYIWNNSGSSTYLRGLQIARSGIAGGGGGTDKITPTLTWSGGLVNAQTVNKYDTDVDFTYTASQDKNSLGALTYSSSDETVATINASGKVHILKAGTTTITANLAESGCYEEAEITYRLNVISTCTDVAGTLTAVDNGCDGVDLTVSGYTEDVGATVIKWYKDGEWQDNASYNDKSQITVTAAGEWYAQTTAGGAGHCVRNSNSVTVTARSAASATRIVNQWYVKNGRRTPDIALVQTTNAVGFYVKVGDDKIWDEANSITTGFGGCDFYLGADGIIYLKGQTSTGAAPSDLTAGDVTLKIAATGCGSNSSELSIVIHKQAATTAKSVAFVVDGTKGGAVTAFTASHATTSPLYVYLDSIGTAAGARKFTLTGRNAYWSTVDSTLKAHYSQFDIILITDDPSTNTVVKKGDDYKTKGYVNALGTLIDIRPILSMEAFVSRLTNWGSKGIKGNPTSPNPRQYEMRLQCKDHEIYSGLPAPAPGTHVWSETIGGEEYRHVIMIDSTKSPYTDWAYNAKTDSLPALQGFTTEAMGDLLGLGVISNGTLQAGIERQEEPAARLLLLGVNAKALPNALTAEGKRVISNALTYLLKTNMEEVDDCSNYFTGGASGTDTDWSKPGNWSKNSLPNYETRVRILAPCEVSGVTAHVAQVDIVSSGESSIRANATGLANCNGKLTINANGALIVEGKVRAADAPHFAANDLKPTTVNDLVLNTDDSGQAALIFNNDEGKTQATVNLYSLGRMVSETNQFQYFAIPMSYLSVNPTFANETHGITIYTYVWLEATGWERRGYYTDLYAFEGIGITTNETTAHEYTMKGTLASTKDQEIPITADGKKLNLIGNSWTAPIQISELEASDFGDASSAVEQTVYIYCAGHGKSTADGKTEAAGQWLAIPFEATRFDAWDGLKVIPSMQAFQIKTKGEGTLTLDYDKHVRGGSTDLTAKLRAPQRRAAHDGVDLMRIRVADSKTHTDLYLFEGDQFSDAFDNGWEANYRVGTNESAKLYARVATGVMSVAAMSDLEGTPIYFIPGQETEYTFTFGGNGMGYYLNDLKLQQSTLISEGAEYSFTYEKGDAAARFMISATPYESPQVTTGTENVQTEDKPRKILYNNKLYIIYNGHVYSADGAIVK